MVWALLNGLVAVFVFIGFVAFCAGAYEPSQRVIGAALLYSSFFFAGNEIRETGE